MGFMIVSTSSYKKPNKKANPTCNSRANKATGILVT